MAIALRCGVCRVASVSSHPDECVVQLVLAVSVPFGGSEEMKIAKQYLVWLQFKSDVERKNSDALSEIEGMIAATAPESKEDLAAKILVALDGVDMKQLHSGSVAGELLRDAAQILENHPLFRRDRCSSPNISAELGRTHQL